MTQLKPQSVPTLADVGRTPKTDAIIAQGKYQAALGDWMAQRFGAQHLSNRARELFGKGEIEAAKFVANRFNLENIKVNRLAHEVVALREAAEETCKKVGQRNEVNALSFVFEMSPMFVSADGDQIDGPHFAFPRDTIELTGGL